MALHVIVGSGPVGSATASRRVNWGQRGRVVTRAGRGPAMDGVECIACDARDVQRLVPLVRGAGALYSCASPAYGRWVTDWPPLATSILNSPAYEATFAVRPTPMEEALVATVAW